MLKEARIPKIQLAPTRPSFKSFDLHFPSSSEQKFQCGSLTLSPSGNAVLDLSEILIDFISQNALDCPLVHPKITDLSLSLKEFIGSCLLPQLYDFLRQEQKPRSLSLIIGKRAELDVHTGRDDNWIIQPSEFKPVMHSDFATYALVMNNKNLERHVRWGQKPTLYDHVDGIAGEDLIGGGHMILDAGTLSLRHLGPAFFDPPFDLLCSAAIAMVALAGDSLRIERVVVDGEIEVPLRVPNPSRHLQDLHQLCQKLPSACQY